MKKDKEVRLVLSHIKCMIKPQKLKKSIMVLVQEQTNRPMELKRDQELL